MAGKIRKGNGMWEKGDMSSGGDDPYLSSSEMKGPYRKTVKHHTVSLGGGRSVCSDCFQEHASSVGVRKQLQIYIFIMHTHVHGHECHL